MLFLFDKKNKFCIISTQLTFQVVSSKNNLNIFETLSVQKIKKIFNV